MLQPNYRLAGPSGEGADAGVKHVQVNATRLVATSRLLIL
jgi:hypothetical protein